jgi:isopentenyl diphosphate isomerase/L-lactate dehydrogenase-like FMN-dependent dehydrogenase
MWFQLYPMPSSGEYNRKTLGEAQDLGSTAIVITVDQQASPYERAMHSRNLTATPSMQEPRPPAPPAQPPTGSMRYRVAPGRLFYTWQLFDDLKKLCKGPMIAKGIATGEDAALCLQHGVDAIFVSNHGGRSIDYGPSTIEILPEIVDAVKGRVPVILDSGIRRGSDILKALALGASAVSCGRAVLWGLGAYGPLGVQRVLEMLQAELKQSMAACGVTSIAQIDRSLARTEFV